MREWYDSIKLFLVSPVNCLILKRKHVRLTKGLPIIRGIIELHGNGSICFGENVCINSSRTSNPIGGDTRTTIVTMDSDAEIIIGNNVGISNSTLCCKESIIIEDDVIIGGNCKIYDNDFHSLDISDRRKGNKYAKSKPIRISKGAFIGAHCILLKGAVIGENSIIGAGSVIAGTNIPSNEIWGGNPARYIKKIWE